MPTSSLRKRRFSLNPGQLPFVPVFATFGVGMKSGSPHLPSSLRTSARNLYSRLRLTPAFQRAVGELAEFYADSEPETVDSPTAQITGQTPEPASTVPMPNRAGALVLELQNDHWVRSLFVSACAVMGVEQGEVLSERRSVQLRSAGMPGLRRLPQDPADFGGKLIRAERFLYELRSGTQDPDIDRRILGVGRHVENL